MKHLVLSLLCATGLLAQVQLEAPSPAPVQSAGAVAQGLLGGETLWYWVIARYPIGTAQPSTPAIAANTVGAPNLSGANYVRISWQAMPGATGYDVLRSADGRYPAPCAACAVVLNTSSLSVDDDGDALSAYPPGGVNAAPGVSAEFTINNRDEASPFINVKLLQNFRLPLISAWTAGHCVEWTAGGKLGDAGAGCGTGGGSGDGLPFTGEKSASNAVTFGSECGTSTACNIRQGNQQYRVTTQCQVAFNAGSTGTFYAYVDAANQITIGHDGLSIASSTGCLVASPVTDFPAGSVPAWSWTVTAGVVAAAGTNARAPFTAPAALGEGMIAPTPGSIAVDRTAVVFKYFAAGPPAGAIAGSRTGDLYIDTITGNEYVCNNSVSDCNGINVGNWVAVGSGGSSNTLACDPGPDVYCVLDDDMIGIGLGYGFVNHVGSGTYSHGSTAGHPGEWSVTLGSNANDAQGITNAFGSVFSLLDPDDDFDVAYLVQNSTTSDTWAAGIAHSDSYWWGPAPQSGIGLLTSGGNWIGRCVSAGSATNTGAVATATTGYFWVRLQRDGANIAFTGGADWDALIAASPQTCSTNINGQPMYLSWGGTNVGGGGSKTQRVDMIRVRVSLPAR